MIKLDDVEKGFYFGKGVMNYLVIRVYGIEPFLDAKCWDLKTDKVLEIKGQKIPDIVFLEKLQAIDENIYPDL